MEDEDEIEKLYDIEQKDTNKANALGQQEAGMYREGEKFGERSPPPYLDGLPQSRYYFRRAAVEQETHRGGGKACGRKRLLKSTNTP